MHTQFICSQDTVVSTEKGSLQGYFYEGVYRFAGVDYARAERFMPPVEIESWEGVKPALTYGKVAMQEVPSENTDDITSPHRFWLQGEDCQNLNIWTPSLEPDAELPVIVWLHGGGFFAGNAIEQIAYDGTSMARLGNVICVTVNHRLNCLGYLDLRKFGKKYSHAVNAGNLDIIAALQWIQRNIRNFGGNPGNVTIFGQSGGGGKVISLMQMPKAAGLFHRAMIMSGTLSDLLSDEGVDSSPVVDKCLEILGLAPGDIDSLTKIPYGELTEAYTKASISLGNKGIPLYTPCRNEDYLGDPMKVGFADFSKNIPVIIGSTFSEFFHLEEGTNREMLEDDEARKALEKRFGTLTDSLIPSFRHAFPNRKLADLLTYDWLAFRKSSIDWAKERVKEGGAAVYNYLFMMLQPLHGTTTPWHCADIPYYFHNVELVPVANNAEKSEKLENAMFASFMAFAKTGNPANEWIPEWKNVSDDTVPTMLWDEEVLVKNNPDEELLKIFSEFHQNTHEVLFGDGES